MSTSVATLAAYAGCMRRINLLRAHGSPTGYLYTYHGCRCVACRAAQASRNRKYHADHAEEGAERSRKYYAEHREERAERGRDYRAEHLEEKAEYDRRRRAEHLEEFAENKRKYRAEHPAEDAERKRKYRKEHREEIAEHKRKYTAEHREEAAARNRAAKARKRNATGTHTAADVQTQYKRQRGRCFWRNVNTDCFVSLKGGYHVDHVIPLAGERTSSNGPENIVLTCPSCNQRKGAKDPMVWAGVMF